MILNLLLINFIITYTWDILNFPNTIAGILTGWITKGRIKHVELKAPLGCSFCMIFWVSLIYLLIAHLPILIAISVALVSAFSSKIILYTITLIDSIIDKLFRWLDGVINK